MRKPKITPYDVAEHLRTPEEMAAYLEACAEESGGDAALMAKALDDVVRAQKRKLEKAEATKMTTPSKVYVCHYGATPTKTKASKATMTAKEFLKRMKARYAYQKRTLAEMEKSEAKRTSLGKSKKGAAEKRASTPKTNSGYPAGTSYSPPPPENRRKE